MEKDNVFVMPPSVPVIRTVLTADTSMMEGGCFGINITFVKLSA